MAKNFRMSFAEQPNHQSVRIQLQGDFDGNSAHELVNFLSKYGSSVPNVAIDTDGLRSIYTFGLDVFINKLKMLRQVPSKIVFIGRFKNDFAHE